MDVSEAVDEMFNRYSWPGNVRKLEHTLKSSLSILHGENTIRRHHLSSYFMNNCQRMGSGYNNQNRTHHGAIYLPELPQLCRTLGSA
ncbi:hypothetical protein DSCA_61870 [Desulfosarcina alkanivorans]|uniref:NorR-like AAA+ ATPase lid domain-containing protein n=1 Tax=Desulfosarcina alkanivorans TaxID=571177 RepID=A0A5K7Z6X6_9BACT|nr:hypothetical protein [Desulfosarcina alkanivorans]BBO72257.1 hypothetical protein DSCA_61870 [Desulfosarcina alkanivorans]